MMSRTLASTALCWANRSNVVLSNKTSTTWKSIRASNRLFSTMTTTTTTDMPAAVKAPKKSRKESAANKVTKATITSVLAEKHSISLAEAGRIMATVTDSIVDALKDKKEVNIAGFGKFHTVLQKATVKRNPSTQAKVDVPEKTRVRFAAFASLKEAVNEK